MHGAPSQIFASSLHTPQVFTDPQITVADGKAGGCWGMAIGDLDLSLNPGTWSALSLGGKKWRALAVAWSSLEPELQPAPAWYVPAGFSGRLSDHVRLLASRSDSHRG